MPALETFATKGSRGSCRPDLLLAEEALRWFASPAPAGGHDSGSGGKCAPARGSDRKLMPLSVALDADGRPRPLCKENAGQGHPGIGHRRLPAAHGRKARPCSIPARSQVQRLPVCSRPWCRSDQGLLPIPKVMRWGDGMQPSYDRCIC